MTYNNLYNYNNELVILTAVRLFLFTKEKLFADASLKACLKMSCNTPVSNKHRYVPAFNDFKGFNYCLAKAKLL